MMSQFDKKGVEIKVNKTGIKAFACNILMHKWLTVTTKFKCQLNFIKLQNYRIKPSFNKIQYGLILNLYFHFILFSLRIQIF